MNYNDVQGKLKTPYTEPTDKYAYFKNGDSLKSSTTVPTGYQKKPHYAASSMENGVEEARFYEWDTGTGITYDENPSSETYQVRFDESGTKYMTPTAGHSVYLTKTYTGGSIGGTNTMQWKAIKPTTDENPETHATSTSSYGDILGSTYGWLASPCVTLDTNAAYFRVRRVSSSSLGDRTLANSIGCSSSGSNGFRPLVSLSSTVLVDTGTAANNGADSSHAWQIK